MSETAASQSHVAAEHVSAEPVAAEPSPAEIRAHYERMLARILDRADPESPHYRPELEASWLAHAKLLQRILAETDDAGLARLADPMLAVKTTGVSATAATHPRELKPREIDPRKIDPRQPDPRERYPREQGRFTPGNPGGPGRPRKIQCVEHDTVSVVVNSISAQDLHEITRVAVAQAKKGDGSARRWIYQMAYRHSRTSINEVAALQETGITPAEHRMLLAQKHFGREMEDIEVYREEMASGVAAEGVEPPTAESECAAAAPVVSATPSADTQAAAPTYAVAPPAATRVPQAGVVEVRLAPGEGSGNSARGDVPVRSEGPGNSARNSQKRPITAENEPQRPERARSNGQAEPQVA